MSGIVIAAICVLLSGAFAGLISWAANIEGTEAAQELASSYLHCFYFFIGLFIFLVVISL